VTLSRSKVEEINNLQNIDRNYVPLQNKLKQMFGAFLNGIALGITITFSFGPGFWALFQTSINKGMKGGFYISLGFFLSNLVLFTIAFIAIRIFAVQIEKSQWMGILAALILLGFGLVSLLKSGKNALKELPEEKMRYPYTGLISKGLLMNVSNPFSLLFWAGVITFSAKAYGFQSLNFFIFITGLLFTAFSFDLIKSFFASRLKRFLNANVQNIINKVIGAILVICAVVIFYRSVF